MEELVSLLLKLKLCLHRSEQNIRELIDLVNDLSLKIEEENPNQDFEKIEISDTLVFDEIEKKNKMNIEMNHNNGFRIIYKNCEMQE